MRKSNLFKFKVNAFIAFLIFSHTNSVYSQNNNSRLTQLVHEVNELFLYSTNQGIFLTPFENRQFERNRAIKNIEWVKEFTMYRTDVKKEKAFPYKIEDNQTIIQNPENKRNSRTYIYDKNGRIQKILRGARMEDQYITDEDGFLIQHGMGGELKKAKREEKVFKWFNMRKDRLEYITYFDDEDRCVKLKTNGHYFGRAVQFEQEEYIWEGNLLLGKNTIRKYKKGGIDSTLVKMSYDSLGLISTIKSRKDGNRRWYTTQYETSVEHLENKQIKITIAHAGKIYLAVTYDHYDNWVEMKRGTNINRKEIKYRKKKRKK